MDVIVAIFVVLGPLLAPLGAYIVGCLAWRGSFAQRRWPPVAWYYGFLLAALLIAAGLGAICDRLGLEMGGAVFFLLYVGLAFWALGFFLGPALLVIERGRNKAITRFCAKCAYDLTGNTSGVCPECGAAISREQREMLERQQAELGDRV